jgi:hypothetical protein
MITAENQDNTSPPWWTLAQMLVWILQQVEIPPQDAAQYCDELTPKTIEKALDALTRALFNAICGAAVEGMPIVAARIRCGSRYEDLAAFFQPLSSQPNVLDALRYDLRQRIRQPDVEFNPVWGKRTWPARVPAVQAAPTPTQPTESAVADEATRATPAAPARVGYVDPAIAHALAHAIKRARPAVPPPEDRPVAKSEAASAPPVEAAMPPESASAQPANPVVTRQASPRAVASEESPSPDKRLKDPAPPAELPRTTQETQRAEELEELVEHKGTPGRKPGVRPKQQAMCAAATNILDNDRRRPKPQGRNRALARMLIKQEDFKDYKLETIEDYIRSEVRGWEKKNPGT